MMLSNIAIASLAFGSAGLEASSVQSQLVHACAFTDRVVPQKGHSMVSKLTVPVAAERQCNPYLNRIAI